MCPRAKLKEGTDQYCLCHKINGSEFPNNVRKIIIQRNLVIMQILNTINHLHWGFTLRDMGGQSVPCHVMNVEKDNIRETAVRYILK